MSNDLVDISKESRVKALCVETVILVTSDICPICATSSLSIIHISFYLSAGQRSTDYNIKYNLIEIKNIFLLDNKDFIV